jgi:hypothetical protein
MQPGEHTRPGGAGQVAVLAGCLVASALPAVLLAAMFAASGHFPQTLLAAWCGVLLGPFCEAVIYRVELKAVWLVIALVCLPLVLAYPLRPSRATALMTAAGFAAWYLAAFLTIVNWEVPV